MLFTIFAQDAAKDKATRNPTVPSAGYLDFMFEPYFIIGVIVLLALVGFLVWRMMRKPAD